MQRCTIASTAEPRAIEGRPYSECMPHAQVHDALAAVASRFGDRPALTALAQAGDASPRRWTQAEFPAEVRRAAQRARPRRAGCTCGELHVAFVVAKTGTAPQAPLRAPMAPFALDREISA